MKCVMCLQGYHLSCLSEECPCRLVDHHDEDQSLTTKELNEDSNDSTGIGRARDSSRGSNGRTGKSDRNLKDQQSTGRKRAAKLYPLDRDAPCEWQGLANCGGGTAPIIGCLMGLQEARHHGPDKSVTNNEEGNVHRICHRCHYNWHANNDASYDWNSTTVASPHNPHKQTDEERKEAASIDLRHMARKSSRVTIKD